jgi:hypothetical protein
MLVFCFGLLRGAEPTLVQGLLGVQGGSLLLAAMHKTGVENAQNPLPRAQGQSNDT